MKKKFKTASPNKITFVAAWDEFLQEREVLGRSPDTIKNYNKTLKMFYTYSAWDNDTLLSEFTTKAIYKWIQHIRSENDTRVTSCNGYLGNLRAFALWCVDKEYLPPMEVKKITGQEELPKLYEPEEIEAMLEKPRENDSFVVWRSWAIVSLVFATGLRASTFCNITIADLNFKERTILIAKQKNKKAAILPITRALETVLKEYIRKWLANEDENCWLFPNIGGEQLTVAAAREAINKYCGSKGFRGHGIHSVRHNFAKSMIMNGAGEIRLQQYLQHSTLQMSQTLC